MRIISETELPGIDSICAIVGSYSSSKQQKLESMLADANCLICCYRGLLDIGLARFLCSYVSAYRRKRLILICNMNEARSYPVAAQAELDQLVELVDAVLDIRWRGDDLPIAATQYAGQVIMLDKDVQNKLCSILDEMQYSGKRIRLVP